MVPVKPLYWTPRIRDVCEMYTSLVCAPVHSELAHTSFAGGNARVLREHFTAEIAMHGCALRAPPAPHARRPSQDQLHSAMAATRVHEQFYRSSARGIADQLERARTSSRPRASPGSHPTARSHEQLAKQLTKHHAGHGGSHAEPRRHIVGI